MGVSHWSVRLARAGGQHRAKFGLLKAKFGALGNWNYLWGCETEMFWGV